MIHSLESNCRINDGISVVEEAFGTSGQKRKYIEGPFISLNKGNRNGRYYTDENFMPNYDIYMRDWVEADRAYGELKHPGKPFLDPERFAIKIVELYPMKDDPNLIWGKALVMKTPLGKLLDAILDDGRMGVSSRCEAIIHPNGWTEVTRIVTAADVITDPSASEAMVSVIQEQYEYLTGGSVDAERILSDFNGKLANCRGKSVTVDDALRDFCRQVAIRL